MTIENSYRQAIITKYHGNSRRISATAQAGRVYVEYDHGLGTQENHDRAAQRLIDEYHWDGLWYSGANPDGTGYVYVNAEFQGKRW